MQYFSTAFISFFKDLSKNNSTEWFQANKKRYESDVKKPFQLFIGDLISEVKKIDPSIQIEVADAIMRINRDIRFSNDKSPYKLHVSAIISSTGKKDKVMPGMYIELAADKISIYGGAYMVDKIMLQKIRTAIAADLKKFDKLIQQKDFVNWFGEILGEKNKIMPPEFKSLLEKQPLLANKNFYFYAELPVSNLVKEDLLNQVITYFKTAKPINEFLITAMK
ncbi:MAG: DUF2461 domain-containing protein [Bacteroidetes bacterium]|nr:DUF2461 domain-containing protein [Bacteroidota bacterium]